MKRRWDGCVREVTGETMNRYGHRLGLLECGHTHLIDTESMGATGRMRMAIGAHVVCTDCRDGLPPKHPPRE